MREEGSEPMTPARLPTPSLAPCRCKAAALRMSLHHQSILSVGSKALLRLLWDRGTMYGLSPTNLSGAVLRIRETELSPSHPAPTVLQLLPAHSGSQLRLLIVFHGFPGSGGGRHGLPPAVWGREGPDSCPSPTDTQHIKAELLHPLEMQPQPAACDHSWVQRLPRLPFIPFLFTSPLKLDFKFIPQLDQERIKCLVWGIFRFIFSFIGSLLL